MEEAPSKVPPLRALALAKIKKELKTPKMIEALNNATPSRQNVVAQTMSEGLVEYKDLTQESSCPNFCSLLAQHLFHKIVLPHCLQTPVCYDAKEMKEQFYFSDYQFFSSPKKVANYSEYMNFWPFGSGHLQNRWSVAFCGENRVVFSVPALEGSNDQTMYNCDLTEQTYLRLPIISLDIETYRSAFIVAAPMNESYYFVVDGCSESHTILSEKYPNSRNLRKCERRWYSKDTVSVDLSSIEGIIHDGICLPDEKIVLCIGSENPENKILKRSVQIWLVQPSSWRSDKLQKLLVINTSKEQDELKLWAVDDNTIAIASYVGSGSSKKLTFFNLQTSEHSEPINFSKFYALDSHVKSPKIALFSSNGKKGTVLSVFDKASKTTTPLLEIPEHLETLKLSPDGQFCVGLNSKKVYLFDLFHKLILARFSNPCESENAPIAISDDSKKVLLGGYIWDIGAFHFLNNPSIGAVVHTMDLIEYQKEVPFYLPGRCSSPQEILEHHLLREREYKAGK